MSENSFLTLAALATVAVPDLDAQAVCPPQGSNDLVEWTTVIDEQSRYFTVLLPRTKPAQETLDKQQKLLPMLRNYYEARRLTFEIPQIVGSTTASTGFTAVVYRKISGNPLNFELAEGNSDLLYALGKAIASLHELPINLVKHSGFDVNNTQSVRNHWRNSLNKAVDTGLVPVELQSRWEQALDEDAWWRFHPTFLHGALSPENVLVADSRILGIQDFSQVSVGDPAVDLAWLNVDLTPESSDLIFDAYHLGRAEGSDPFLRQRVELYVELELINWLNWGVEQQNPAIISDAQELLNTQLEQLGTNLSMTGNPLPETEKTPISPIETTNNTTNENPVISTIPNENIDTNTTTVEISAVDENVKP